MSGRCERLGDAELGARLGVHDIDALAELYDRYGAIAYAVALRVLGDSRRSEDIVQKAFLEVWDAPTTFDSRHASLCSWVLSAVRQCAVVELPGRARHQRNELVPDAETATGLRVSDSGFQVAPLLNPEAVRAGLQALPIEQRRVVELAYFGGFSGREIAQVVGCQPVEVKRLMRLALERLDCSLQVRGLEPDEETQHGDGDAGRSQPREDA